MTSEKKPNRVVLHLNDPSTDMGLEGWWHVCDGANGTGLGWYVPETDALAAVAEAYEAAIDLCENATPSPEWADDTKSTYRFAGQDLARSIRKATPADALTAREARDKQVREDALRVKPLVWSGRGAFCDFGAWQIVTDDDEDFGYRFSGSPNVVFWHWKTEEEAKAAAQADYERRILSALIEGETDE